jgi:uncharacterized membrane protein YqjE
MEPFPPHPRILFLTDAWKETQPLKGNTVIKLLLFCILLVVCWPLALVALLLYPIIWLVSLPFRLAGIAVTGAFALVTAIFLLPARVLRAV